MAIMATTSAMPTIADKKKVVSLVLALALAPIAVVTIGSGSPENVVTQFVFVCGVVTMQVKVVVDDP